MDYQNCLKVLREKTTIQTKGNLKTLIKPVPETDRPGVPDPRAAHWFRSLPKAYQMKDPFHPTNEDIQILRDAMGCQNTDLSHGVKTNSSLISTEAGDVPVFIYSLQAHQPAPLICYIHGGGFFGGSTSVVENACKLLAERSGAVVISIDYGLAPDFRFPINLFQCWGVVCWARDHAQELGIDNKKIIISGDSAGGNLSLGCCLLDQEHLIKAQLLLYPAIVVNPDIDYGWTWDAYEMKEDQDAALLMVHDLMDSIGTVPRIYPQTKADLFNQLLSPWQAADYAHFPTTFLAVGEYDYLKQEAQIFCEKLGQSGVSTHLCYYKGMGHAFFEHTGEFPQAEDCADEMAKIVRSLS